MYNFLITTATRKILALRKRIRAVAGGTSASKTISILMWLIDYSNDPRNVNKLCTVTSESYPHLLKGAILDFQNIMKDRGYWRDDLWHDTKHVYTFDPISKEGSHKEVPPYWVFKVPKHVVDGHSGLWNDNFFSLIYAMNGMKNAPAKDAIPHFTVRK